MPSAQKVVSCKKAVLDRHISYASLPKSYSTNSLKESTLLEYAEDFRRQFVQVFPARRPLTLCPLNECGVRKFLPSTIRPCLLPYHDCYDLADAAQFVSDYLTALPLDDPTRLPDLVASPSTMLAVRKGDCMDLSIFLVSLLRGAGYNAYVVTGYAPQWITDVDQSDVVCPLLPDLPALAKKASEDAARAAEEERVANKYAILQKPLHTSKYRAARAQEIADSAAKIVADEEARVRKIKEKASDPLHGQRAHAWVLVSRGRRDLTEEFFVEATTGVIYPVGRAPYLGVDALFNEANYWVNVQTHLGALVPVAQMSWDLGAAAAWEYVLIDERKYRDSVLSRGNGAKGDLFGATTSASASASAAAAAANSAANNSGSAGAANAASSAAKNNFEAVNEAEGANDKKEVSPEDTVDDRDVKSQHSNKQPSIHRARSSSSSSSCIVWWSLTFCVCVCVLCCWACLRCVVMLDPGRSDVLDFSHLDRS